MVRRRTAQSRALSASQGDSRHDLQHPATRRSPTDTAGGDTAAPPRPYPHVPVVLRSGPRAGCRRYPQGARSRIRRAAPVVEQPPSIVRAVRLMWAGAGLSLLSIVVGLLTLGSLKDNIRTDDQEQQRPTPSPTSTPPTTSRSSPRSCGGVIGIALWLWMA